MDPILSRMESNRYDSGAGRVDPGPQREALPVPGCAAYDGRVTGGAMIQVRVLGIALDQSGQHLVLLTPLVADPDEPRVLPIWIGSQEANSILIALNGEHTPRPLTHDLTMTLVDVLGARVEQVEVTRLDGGTFFAELTLVTRQGPRVVDARPSDAIALAVRADAAIRVAEVVFEDASIPAALAGAAVETDEDASDEAPQTGTREDASAGEAAVDEAKLEEFKRFLDEVDPEDFEG
jgi:bifunctional DNase/RNase